MWSVLECTTKVEQEVVNIEQRLSEVEDKILQHVRAVRYLGHREERLWVKYDDLESRSR